MKSTNMQTLQLSDSTIATLKSLRTEDYNSIMLALAAEYIMHEDPRALLTPVQMVIYTFLRFNIEREDTVSKSVSEIEH